MPAASRARQVAAFVIRFACPKTESAPESPFWVGTNDRMAAGDAPGMREDDAVSFSGDEDGDGSMDAGCIDAEDVAALLDEREAAAPDEPLSLATIARRNLPDDFLELAEPEAIARAVAKLDQVRLDRCRLASFVGGVSVEVRRASFANVTALYLQHNRLTSTRGVDGETLPRLRFLALQGNRLRAVAELGTLRHLALLDLSENPNLSRLDELVSAMPSSMRFLSCAGCGCAADGDYRAALVASLPRLKRLDGVDVTGRERDDAMAAFGEDEDEGEGEREGEDEGNRGDRTRSSGGGARRERRSAAKAVGWSSARNESTAASSSFGDAARSREIRAMLPMLEDPEMLVDAMGAAVRSLALDAVGEMDARADDVRSNARNARATRDGDADLTMEARVRAARRRQDASITEAGTMMPFDEFAGPEVL